MPWSLQLCHDKNHANNKIENTSAKLRDPFLFWGGGVSTDLKTHQECHQGLRLLEDWHRAQPKRNAKKYGKQRGRDML